jgi:para-nitrobenzyl esterase
MLGIGRERLNELQDIPAATLLSTMDRYLATLPPGLGGLRMGFSPVLDGRYVTHHPFDPLASPLADHIPLIVGCTAHEMSLFSLRDPDAFTLDWAHLQARVAGMTDAGRAEEIIALYRAAEPESSPSRIFFEIGTDRSMRANAIFAAQSKAKQAAPVFAYLFAWESPAMGGALGATHTVEIPFVFDNTDIPVEMTTGGAEEKALAAKVSDAWISFARTGNPSHPGIGQWPAYDEAGRATMILDRDPRAEPDPDRAKRLLWQSMTIG